MVVGHRRYVRPAGAETPAGWNRLTRRTRAAMVKRGELKYVLLGSGGGGRGGNSEITAWVQAHGTKVSGVSTSGGTLTSVGASPSVTIAHAALSDFLVESSGGGPMAIMTLKAWWSLPRSAMR